MKSRFRFILLFIFLTSSIAAQTIQEPLLDLIDKIVAVNIEARLVGKEGEETIWKADNSKLTIFGRGAIIEFHVTDYQLNATITPFLNEDGSIILIAQGDLFDKKDHGNPRLLASSIKLLYPVKVGQEIIFIPGVDITVDSIPGSGWAVDSENNTYMVELEIKLEKYKVSYEKKDD